MEDKGGKAARTRRAPAKAPAGAVSRTAAVKAPATTKAPTATKPAAPGKSSAKAAAAPAGASGPDRDQLVRMAAYFRAERRGFAPGYEVEDWLAAEAEVVAKLGPAPASAGKSAARKPKSG